MAVQGIYFADMHRSHNNFCNQWGVDAVFLATRQSADGVEVSVIAGDSVTAENVNKNQAPVTPTLAITLHKNHTEKVANVRCLSSTITYKKLAGTVTEWPILDQPRGCSEFFVEQLELQ